MIAGSTPEKTIELNLEHLGCAENLFAQISKVVGRTRLAEGITGKKAFDIRRSAKSMQARCENCEIALR
jgi:hypothetical protein